MSDPNPASFTSLSFVFLFYKMYVIATPALWGVMQTKSDNLCKRSAAQPLRNTLVVQIVTGILLYLSFSRLYTYYLLGNKEQAHFFRGTVTVLQGLLS